MRARRWTCLAAALLLAGACASGTTPEPEVPAAEPPPPPPTYAPIPFAQLWLRPNTDLRSYTKLYVAPVDTSRIAEEPGWASVDAGSVDVDRNAEKLGKEFRQALVNAFALDPARRFQVLGSASAIDDQTMILDVDLVEVLPSQEALTALGAMGWSGTRPPATGSVAFQAYARDGRTQALLAQVADRQAGKAGSTSWYGHAGDIFGGWSQYFVDLSAKSSAELRQVSKRF